MGFSDPSYYSEDRKVVGNAGFLATDIDIYLVQSESASMLLMCASYSFFKTSY
jgi:hypothetical protein